MDLLIFSFFFTQN